MEDYWIQQNLELILQVDHLFLLLLMKDISLLLDGGYDLKMDKKSTSYILNSNPFTYDLDKIEMLYMETKTQIYLLLKNGRFTKWKKLYYISLLLRY